ncbi:MAG: hypothetical protein MMC33_008246 [Icmadophila ericetorum]|nr:hypothetical protein [Icmadophila ericetorum]
MAQYRSTRSSSKHDVPEFPRVPGIPIFRSRPQPSGRRTTRSASREIVDGSAGRMKKPRALRGSSAESDVSDGASRVTRNTRQKPSPELSRVEEDEHEYEADTIRVSSDRGESFAEEDSVPNNAPSFAPMHREPSPASTSAMSRVTSYSAQELAEMKPWEMQDTLIDLHDATSKLLAFVTDKSEQQDVPGFLLELEDPDSRVTVNLIRLRETLRLHKKPFGNEQYINLYIVLRGILGVQHKDDVGSGPWRPDNIFYETNLAILIYNLLLLYTDENVIGSMLDKLDLDFPVPFLSSFGETGKPGESRLLRESVDLAIDLRTQLCIDLLQNKFGHENFDPDEVVTAVFYENPENNPATLKGWSLSALNMDDEQKNEVHRRMQQIRESFGENTQSVDMNLLTARFPWSGFISRVISWCKLRSDEIEVALQSSGGVSVIRKAIEKEQNTKQRAAQDLPLGADADNDNGDIDLLSQYRPDSIDMALDISALMTGKPLAPAIRYMKKTMEKRKRDSLGAEGPNSKRRGGAQSVERSPKRATALTRLNASQVSPQIRRKEVSIICSTKPQTTGSDLSVEGTGNINAGRSVSPLFVTDDNDDNRLIISQVVAEVKEAENQQNKENILQSTGSKSVKAAFIDRQPGAEKVIFDSQASTQEGPSAPRRSSKARGKQKAAGPRLSPDKSEDEEDAFSIDDRPDPQRSSPQPHPARRTTSYQTRQRSTIAHTSPLQERDAASATRRSQRKIRPHRATPAQQNRSDSPFCTNSSAPSSPPRSQADIYREVNQASRTQTALGPKPPQTRHPWSEAEINLLCDGIAKHGTQWSTIKKEDTADILHRRGQVGLKDKARNIKYDFLNAGIRLPAGFELVPLHTNQKKKLRAGGKLPESDAEDDDER